MSTEEKAIKLRERLHQIPELSNCEKQTKQALIEYLKECGELEIVDCGKWFYAAHREGENLPSYVFRADMDGILGEDGKAYHGCGHDGHSSVMASLAQWTCGKTFGKNLFFLFQHAEETGEGGKECVDFFNKEKADFIFGFHNCPGFPLGSVLMLKDTFACASEGLILKFSGTQSHAAYPGNGNNPVFPMARFFSRWDELTDPDKYKGLVLATPVGINAGGRFFGVAAGKGEIDLTVRAWYDEDLKKLENSVISICRELSRDAGIEFSYDIRDDFIGTHNSDELYELVEKAAEKAGLNTVIPNEPFRWSEDFGQFGQHCKAFMCGIGAGENAPGLHTPEYKWNDEVTHSAIKLFKQIIKS